MKIRFPLLFILITFGVSPVSPQTSMNEIQEVSFSKPSSCTCVFPQFYFFNRTYLVDGKSRFEPYSVNKDGSVRKAPELKVPNIREPRAAKDATGFIHGVYDHPDLPGVYPRSNWKVRIVWDQDQSGASAPMYLEYRKDGTGTVKRLEIPQGEYSFAPRPVYFDTKRSLLFFAYMDGPTGGRDVWLWVFDLNHETIHKIGEALDFNYFLDPTQGWLVWTDGKQSLDVIGGKNVLTGHVVCYNLDTGNKYKFTDGVSIGFFYDWNRQK